MNEQKLKALTAELAKGMYKKVIELLNSAIRQIMSHFMIGFVDRLSDHL